MPVQANYERLQASSPAGLAGTRQFTYLHEVAAVHMTSVYTEVGGVKVHSSVTTA